MTDDTPDSKRAQWLERRRTRICSTDVAQILGVSPYGSPMSVYLEKTGRSTPEPQKSWQTAGHRMERAILEWYADEQQVRLGFHDPHEIQVTPERPLFGATLDAFRFDDVKNPVDAKNYRIYDPRQWGEPGTDQMPVYLAAQLVIQMVVLPGALFADLAALFSGQDFMMFRLHRDPALEKDILDRCEHWWAEHIVKDEPPAVDGSDDYTKYLSDRFRKFTEDDVLAEGDALEALQQSHRIRQELKVLVEEQAAADNAIRAAIGPHYRLVGGGIRATWSKPGVPGKATDWQAAFVALSSFLKGGLPAGDVVDAESVIQSTVDKFTIDTKPSARRLTLTGK